MNLGRPLAPLQLEREQREQLEAMCFGMLCMRFTVDLDKRRSCLLSSDPCPSRAKLALTLR